MKTVLFLCTGNSCRSQMAEGLLRAMASDEYDVYSAGVAPSTLNPNAVLVMTEMNIDISAQYSKSIDALPKTKFDYVITLCDHAKQVCPVFPGTQQLHWGMPDPFDVVGTEEEKRNAYRACRDALQKRIRE